MTKSARSSVHSIHKTARFWASEILIAMLVAGVARAEAVEIRVPEPATVADNACASLAASALMHAEAQVPLYIERCGENPNKIACEETVRIMKEVANGGSYGLTCLGGRRATEGRGVISRAATESTLIREKIKADRAKAKADEESGPHERPWDRDSDGHRPWERALPKE
jgi:hypothetical protein